MQSVIALGSFDGMHAGHRCVIARTVEEARKTGAKSMVYTFKSIPRAVFAKDPGMLMTCDERKKAMLDMGVDEVVMVEFTEEFAKISPETFIKNLMEAYHPRALVAGEDYSFGHKAAGRKDTLIRLGKEMGFEAIIIPVVRVVLPDGKLGDKISSTDIRRAINDNRPELARQIALGCVSEKSGSAERNT